MLSNRVPFEIFLYNNIIVQIAIFSISFLIALMLVLFLGVKLSWTLLIFPFFLLPLIGTGYFIGLIGSILRVVVGDIGKMLDAAIKTLMLLSPVLYTADTKIGIMGQILKYNPLTYLIEVPRTILFDGVFVHVELFLGLSITILILCVVMTHFCIKSSPGLLERIVNQ